MISFALRLGARIHDGPSRRADRIGSSSRRVGDRKAKIVRELAQRALRSRRNCARMRLDELTIAILDLAVLQFPGSYRRAERSRWPRGSA
jgi:hypothetical protein